MRFPLLGDNIFNELDSKDFCKSKEVSRSWGHFIRNERVLQKAYKKRIQEKIQILTEETGVEPLYLAAERGYLPVCQQIMENANDKNPKDWFEVTPLHKAAQNGHLSVCQLIVENVGDKNPKDLRGRTPIKLTENAGIKKLIQDAIKNDFVK